MLQVLEQNIYILLVALQVSPFSGLCSKTLFGSYQSSFLKHVLLSFFFGLITKSVTNEICISVIISSFLG